MAKAMCIRVQKEFCEECSLALRRFIGGQEGIESIDASEGQITISYDEALIDAERLFAAVCENVERLGYKIITQGESI
ncbi:MAG TPA: hypothetical protein VK448_09170 [Dissulfurispiraceae bacterium]|nr:hypothetical protein [Dissulfurispiraceae bacterium]